MADSIEAPDIAAVLPADKAEGQVIIEIEGIGKQAVKIVSTRSNLQGFIRWVICSGCGKRVKKLYMQVGSAAFLCRVCSGLEYKTQYNRAYRKIKYERKRPIRRLKKRRLTREELLREMRKFLH